MGFSRYRWVQFTLSKSLPLRILLSGHTARTMSCYRTCSHAGFPKGSYLNPNPLHFHIAHQTQIAIRRPQLITIASHNISSRYLFNHGRTPTVTLNLGLPRSVSVNIPLETLTGFIFPFASALNFRNIPLLNNQACQTTYMSNFEQARPVADYKTIDVTPLYVDSYNTCQTEPEPLEKTDMFERRVLTNLQQNILATDFSSDSELELPEILDAITENKESQDYIVHFNEQFDGSVVNESLIKLDPFPLLLSSSSSDIETTESTPSGESSSGSNSKLNIQSVTELAERFVDTILKEGKEAAIIEKVVVEAKEILKDISDSMVTMYSSTDEGIEDCTLSINTTVVKNSTLDKSIEEGVLKLSKLIFDYLVQQCLEVKELILFPEILHDPNIVKLIDQLIKVFDEFYEIIFTSEQKNDLRISVATQTLKLLEVEDMNSSQDSNTSNTISDKLFTISEFLNDILDHFFDSLDKKRQFDEFSKHTIDNQNNIFHSTPALKTHRVEKVERDTDSVKKSSRRNIEEQIEVTTFKKATKRKSGTESYWIMLSPVPIKAEAPRPKRPMINVDDIPLKPPKDLDYSFRTLSPISEEPRVNLFQSVLTEDDDLFTDASVNSQHMNISLSSEENLEEIDAVLRSECEKINSYMSFDKPDDKVVICNTANFLRTNTVTSDTFIQKKKVVFKPLNEENKENDPNLDNSGDWMGFETARF